MGWRDAQLVGAGEVTDQGSDKKKNWRDAQLVGAGEVTDQGSDKKKKEKWRSASLVGPKPAKWEEAPIADPEEAARIANTNFKLKFASKRLHRSPIPDLFSAMTQVTFKGLSKIQRVTGFGDADESNRIANAFEQASREMDKERFGEDTYIGGFSRNFRGASVTLPEMTAAGAIAGPYGAIGAAMLGEANEAITEGRDAGLEGADLAEYVAAQAVIEGGPASIMQKVGLGGLESMFGKQASRVVSSGIMEGLKKLGIGALSELTEENLTEIGHNVASDIAGVTEGATKPENIWQTIKDTTVQTGLTYGLVAGSQSTLNYAERTRAKAYDKARAKILEMADSGDTPSRKEWIHDLKMPLSEGKTAGQRRGRLEFVAAEIRRRDAALAELKAAAEQAAPEAATDATPETAPVAQVQQVAPEVIAAEPSAQLLATQEPQAATPEESPVASTKPPQVEQQLPVEQDAQEARTGARMAPSKHDIEVEAQGTGEAVGGREVVRQLERIWGKKFRRGRLGAGKSSGVRGIYKTHSQITRLAKGEEASVAVAAHELAHYLDYSQNARKGWSNQAIQELGKLDYDQKAQRPNEGFAEFVRAVVTGSTQHIRGIDLASSVPHAFAEFSRFLKANPEIRAKIDESKKWGDKFRGVGAVGRVKGQVSKTGVDESAGKRTASEVVHDVADSAYTKLKEEAYPVKLFEKEAKARGATFEPGKSPYDILNATRSSASNRAAESIEHGIYTVDFQEKLGPSLSDVLSKIEQGEDYENFVAWAYARHAVESWGLGKNPGITLEDAKETVKQLYDKRYEEAADSLTQWNNALIDMLSDAGCMTEEEATKIKEYYKTYIPLHRAKPNAKGKKVSMSRALRRRHGSGLQIIDPVEASLARAAKFFEVAQKQQVVNNIFKTAKDIKGLGEWVEVVPADTVAHHFGIEDVRKQLTAQFKKGMFGYKPSEEEADLLDSMLSVIDPTAVMAIWRPEMFNFHGEPIFRLQIDGKPVLVQLKPELAESLDVLSVSRTLWRGEAIAKVLVGWTKFFQTRANPSFQIANAIRDYQNFLHQGSKGIKGIVDPAMWASAYAVNELRISQGLPGDPLIELWKRSGGELSTYVGLDRDKLKAGVHRAMRGRPSRRETASNLLGITEVGSRIAEFSAVLNQNGWLERVKAGETPPFDVIVQSMNASNDVTTNFARMGAWGRHLNSYIPFINARVESLDKFARTWKNTPKTAAIRAAEFSVIPALAYWWWKHDDDDYKERPWWQDAFAVLTDPWGNKWRIPKPQEWGIIWSGVERMMDFAYDRDPEAIERWGAQVFRTVDPGLKPAGITPVLETAANYSMFRERPIVSERLQKLQGRDQFYEHTSALAKGAADFLYETSGGKVDLSPAKIDYLTDALAGGVYRRITSPVEKFVKGEGWKLADAPGLKSVTLRKDYSKSIDDFYDYANELDKAHSSHKLRKEKYEDLDKWRETKYAAELMTDIRKAGRDLPQEQRDKVDDWLTGISRAVLDRPQLDSYPNPLADPSKLPSPIRKVVQEHIGRKANTATQRATTPKSMYEANAAIRYLFSVGVTQNAAGVALYQHLIKHGMKSGKAAERVVQIERTLPGKSK